MTEVEIVQKIIEAELQNSDKVSRYYVCEQIKIEFHPTQLYNKILTCGDDSDDGIRNIREGAKKLFRDALRNLRLRRMFYIDDDGFVRRMASKRRGRPEQYNDEVNTVFKDIVQRLGLIKGREAINKDGIFIDGVHKKIRISLPTLSKYVKKSDMGGDALELKQGRPKKNKNTPSRISGVSYDKSRAGNKWKVCINIGCVRHTVGYYPTVEDAIDARKEAERLKAELEGSSI